MQIDLDRNVFNSLNASRKADRTRIADVLEAFCMKHGATVTERRDEPANPGYNGQGIALRIECNGVGCMIDIDDLHGGEWSLIHWFNSTREIGASVRNFTSRFQTVAGSGGNGRPHHKATSHPRDWYSLAMMLDGALLLASHGEAFEPEKAEASAT